MSQIIDKDGQITPNLSSYLSRLGLTNVGTDYHVIAIIGAQSSGKSTLLNHLFNTNFETLDESKGRHQTTLGIHIGYSTDQRLLLLDVEGADSRERGDADCLFERKSALLALALSEVLLVNISQNDIGRYNASGMPLLKTVFEVNLQLFSSKVAEAKCHLLFVIRDVTQDHETIGRQVYNDLKLIWSQLVFPKEFQQFLGRPLEDFFIFHYFALPHFVYCRGDFTAAVGKLRGHFIDTDDSEFLFHTPTGKIMPGDGLAHYIGGVWEAVNENRELNLPSQRKTLSIYKCDEFVKEGLTSFAEALTRPEFEAVNVAPGVDGFGALVLSVVSETVSRYNQDSARYSPEVVSEKREALREGMKGKVPPLFVANCTRALERAESQFTAWLSGFAEFPDGGWRDLAEAERDECIGIVQRRIESSQIPDWQLTFEPLDELQTNLDDMLARKEVDLVTTLEKSIAQRWSATQKEAAAGDLEEAAPDMWARMRAKLRENIRQAHAEFRERATANVRPTFRLDGHIAAIEFALGRTTHSRALVATRDIGQKIHAHFEKKFSLDEQGDPRTWNESTDVAKLYGIARQESLDILRMFSACQLREKTDRIPPADPLTGTLIGASAMELAEETFQRDIEKKYVDAVRIKEAQRNRTQIPAWMVGAYVVLGGPKLINIARHPWLAILAVLLFAVLAGMYQYGMLDEPIGFAKKYGNIAARWVVSRLVSKKKRAQRRKKEGRSEENGRGPGKRPACKGERTASAFRVGGREKETSGPEGTRAVLTQ